MVAPLDAARSQLSPGVVVRPNQLPSALHAPAFQVEPEEPVRLLHHLVVALVPDLDPASTVRPLFDDCPRNPRMSRRGLPLGRQAVSPWCRPRALWVPPSSSSTPSISQPEIVVEAGRMVSGQRKWALQPSARDAHCANCSAESTPRRADLASRLWRRNLVGWLTRT